MTNQKIYKVTLKSLGRMTQLPDSQRLFGALIHRYREQTSEAETTELVAKISNRELGFSLSNVLPKDYLPVSQSFFAQKGKNKATYKEIKKRAFLKKEQLLELLENPKEDVSKFPYISLEDSQQIHASIDSLRYDLPWLKSNLYSVPETVVVEHQEKEKEKEIKEFKFFMSGNDTLEMDNLIKCLNASISNQELFILGPRSSQGLNLYQMEPIKPEEEFGSLEAETFLNLGMLLPDKFDFEKSYLKLFTSERRPFNSYGERNKDTQKQFISFIEAGSLICLKEKQQLGKASRSVPSPFDSSGKQVVFGQAFLYPLPAFRGTKDE